VERCNPAVFSVATGCTRPRHHWCPPDPAWEQEEAADRLVTTQANRISDKGEDYRRHHTSLFQREDGG
jgi:hypothetical protein